jgi:glycosyltransferase involved in cell wall biosynthesis
MAGEMNPMVEADAQSLVPECRLAVIWIDWYPYHVARFRGLEAMPELAGRTVGLEMVGGIGVHAGLKFREELPKSLPIETLLPETSWRDANQFKVARMLWQRLSELKPQIVLVPGYYTLPAIAAAVWARLHGAASVLMTESCAMDHARVWWKESAKALGLRLLFGWAVTGGKLHVDYLRELGFAPHRIAGGYDVVDNELFSVGTEELRDDASTTPECLGLPRSPYFLYVGRLAEEKNVSLLLMSWLDYRKSGGTWPLVLVGDGPEAAALKATVARSPYAADVLFPGLKASRDLLPFYAFAGCFVLPSTREPWGLVVNEAMAAGLPVLVSSRCGCVPELVSEGVNGYLFDPSQYEARSVLCAALASMAEMPAEQRLRMGEASAEIIRGFSPKGFGRSVAAIMAASQTLSPARGAY